MKKTSVYALMILTLTLLYGAQSVLTEENSIAMVVKVEGTVKVQRGKKEKTIIGQFPLALGDKIIVSNKSYALVLFENGKKVKTTTNFEISKKNSMIVGKTSSIANTTGELVKSFASDKRNNDLERSGGVGGAVRAASSSPIKIVSPMNGSAIISTTPSFSWRTSPSADKCAITLLDQNNKPVFNDETNKRNLEYPNSADNLTNGMQYTLKIECTTKDGILSDKSVFTIMSKSRAAEVSKTVKATENEYKSKDDLIIRHMLLAKYYVDKEMFTEAASEYKQIIIIDPKSVDAHIALKGIYVKSGNETEANIERQIISDLFKKYGDSFKF